MVEGKIDMFLNDTGNFSNIDPFPFIKASSDNDNPPRRPLQYLFEVSKESKKKSKKAKPPRPSVPQDDDSQPTIVKEKKHSKIDKQQATPKKTRKRRPVKIATALDDNEMNDVDKHIPQTTTSITPVKKRKATKKVTKKVKRTIVNVVDE